MNGLISWFLIIGGSILLVDGVASLVAFRGQKLFNQVVRLERSLFALSLIVMGVML
jgi:hypothetical protein